MKILGKVLGAAAAVVLAASIFGCSNGVAVTGNNDVYGLVSGVVYENDDDGQLVPVVGATVSIGAVTTTTNGAGAYVLSNVIANGAASGEYTVSITKDGYFAKTATFRVDPKEYLTADQDGAVALTDKVLKLIETIGVESKVTISSTGAGTVTETVTVASPTNTITNTGFTAEQLDRILTEDKYDSYTYVYAVSAGITKLIACDAGITGKVIYSTKYAEAKDNNVGKKEAAAPVDVVITINDVAANTTLATTKTDKDGAFKVEKLPRATALQVVVGEFTVDGVTYPAQKFTTSSAYLSTATGNDNAAVTITTAGKASVTDIGYLVSYAGYTDIALESTNVQFGSIKTTDAITLTFDKNVGKVTIDTWSNSGNADVAIAEKVVTLKPTAKATRWTVAASSNLGYDLQTLKLNVTDAATNKVTVFTVDVKIANTLAVTASSAYNPANPTEVVKLPAKTAAVTFTFDKEIESVTDVPYSIVTIADKTVTVTKKEGGYIPNGTVIGFTATAKDGTSLVVSQKVTIEELLKVVSSNIYDVNAIEKEVKVLPNAALEFTFDKPIAKVENNGAATWLNDYNVTIADAKVTLTKKTGFLTAGTANFVAIATDGTTATVTQAYKILNDLEVTEASFYDAKGTSKAKEIASTTEALTITFNKEIAYVVVKNGGNTTTLNGLVDDTTVTVADKTVTVKTLNGQKFASGTLAFAVTAKDGTTKAFSETVTVESALVLTATSIADLSDPNKKVEVSAKSPITFTFSKEIAKVDTLTVTGETGYEADDAVISGNTVTVSPKAYNKKFTLSKIAIKVIAKDGSECNVVAKNVNLVTFKSVSTEIIKASEIPATARAAVTVANGDALKITFSMNVKSVKDITVGGKPATAKVDGKVVYIVFNDTINTEATPAVAGTIVSEEDDEASASTIVSDTFSANTEYSIEAVNWGGKGASINGGANNSTVETTLIGNEVKLTFNKEFPAESKVTAELYKDVTKSVSTDSYACTATVAGKVVTITSTLDKGTQYYVALRVADKDDVTLFTTKRTIKVAADLDVSGGFSILDSNKKYITFKTKGVAKLVSGVKTATTDYATGKNSLPVDVASITLEFDSDVSNYKALVASAALTDATYEDAVKSATYKSNAIDATATFAGKVLTVTPAGVLAVSKVYITVYDEKGALVTALDGTNDYKAYVIDYSAAKSLKAALAKGATYAKKLEGLALDEEKNKAKDIDSDVTPVALKVNSLKEANVTYSVLKSVKAADGNYADYTALGISTTSTEQDAIRKIDTIYINGSKTADDLLYGNIKYVITSNKKGITYVSNELEVADGKAPTLTLAGGKVLKQNVITKAYEATLSDFNTFINSATTKTFTVNASEFVTNASIAVTPASTKAKAKVEYKTNTSFDVIVSGTVANSDVFTIKASDTKGNETTVVIKVDGATPVLALPTKFGTPSNGVYTVKLSDYNDSLTNNTFKISSDEALTSLKVDGADLVTALTKDKTEWATATMSRAAGDTITIIAVDTAGNSVTLKVKIIAG